MSDEYDLIVLGAGTVGENIADRAVQGGLSVAIVEHELVGGECSYWACTPSKALLRPLAARRAAKAVRGAREAVTGDVDVAEVLARRNWFVGDWSDEGQVSWLESADIALIRGHGRLSGIREVTVTEDDGAERTLRARHAVAIATGSRAAIPPIDGLAEAEPWTSRDATSANEIPGSLAIIGGGVVAVEMATVFAGLGATVTVLARTGVLGGFESFAGERVVDALREQGVDVRLDTETVRVRRDIAGVTITTGDGVEIHADEVLVATGRVPRSDDIGIEAAGLEPGRPISTDDTMRVPGVDWLYAAGDVTGRVLMTHQGKYEARAAGDVIAARATGAPVDDAPWGRHVATADHRAVPQVVFGDPEVAAVGLTEAAARDAGIDVAVVDYDLGAVAGAKLHADRYAGLARAIIDKSRDVLVGATFVGPDVAELLHAATIAIVGEVPVKRLWHAVPSYPTVSEVWLRLCEEYGRESA
ncbi:dihydrolipoyl dehydrogenase family protein [Microbacterium keratanolyticum]